MVNFPASLDALANPGSTTKRNDPGFELHTVISTLNDIAEAVEAKVGISEAAPQDSPLASTILGSATNGKSKWRQVVNADIAAGAAIALTKLATTPAARVFNSANLSIADSTLTFLTLDSETFDNDTIHSTGSNTDRLTCVTAGKYLIFADVQFASNATGIRAAEVVHSGGSTIVSDFRNAVNGNVTVIPIATVWDMAAGEYVRVRAYQTSGGALNVQVATAYTPMFGMVRVG